LVLGAVGGVGTGRTVKSVDLGSTGNIIAGAIGGLGGTWLLGLVPGLTALLGSGTGVDDGTLISQAVSGLVGGGVLTAIVGAIKNATMKA
jgi:hypothetical protein